MVSIPTKFGASWAENARANFSYAQATRGCRGVVDAKMMREAVVAAHHQAMFPSYQETCMNEARA